MMTAGIYFLHIMSEMWVTFWFQRYSGSEGRKALQTFELMYEMFMQKVEFVICTDVIASTVEKDTENQMLLYFVICVVIEPIRVGHSGKACFAGRKLQWLTIFVVSEYYTDVVKVCWPKNVSGYFISVSFYALFWGFFFSSVGRGDTRISKIARQTLLFCCVMPGF